MVKGDRGTMSQRLSVAVVTGPDAHGRRLRRETADGAIATALVPPLLAFVTGGLPVFLTGALARQLREDLHFGPHQLGLAVAVFWAAGALASAPLGRFGEHIGAGAALRIGATTSAVAMAGGAVARSWGHLTLALAVAGTANALIEPAANVHVARTVGPRRLGLAFGIKQASMPTASLIGALAVPIIAVPFGWRWAFAMGSIAALSALLGSPRSGRVVHAAPSEHRDYSLAPLSVLAVGVAAASAAAASVNAFVVDSSGHSRVSPADAATLVAVGSALGIMTRVHSGLHADRRAAGRELQTVCRLLLAGAAVFLILATGNRQAFILAAPLAYATAWGWPALLHLAIVRLHQNAPGAATGVINTGAFFGAVAGPLLGGVLAAAHGYTATWLSAACWSLAGATVIFVADKLFRATVTAKPRPEDGDASGSSDDLPTL